MNERSINTARLSAALAEGDPRALKVVQQLNWGTHPDEISLNEDGSKTGRSAIAVMAFEDHGELVAQLLRRGASDIGGAIEAASVRVPAMKGVMDGLASRLKEPAEAENVPFAGAPIWAQLGITHPTYFDVALMATMDNPNNQTGPLEAVLQHAKKSGYKYNQQLLNFGLHNAEDRKWNHIADFLREQGATPELDALKDGDLQVPQNLGEGRTFGGIQIIEDCYDPSAPAETRNYFDIPPEERKPRHENTILVEEPCRAPAAFPLKPR